MSRVFKITFFSFVNCLVNIVNNISQVKKAATITATGLGELQDEWVQRRSE